MNARIGTLRATAGSNIAEGAGKHLDADGQAIELAADQAKRN